MTLPELCIRRPVMTCLLMVTCVMLGVAGYRQLPVAALPRVDFPTIQVSASLSGASPETMASAVATPLEKQFATIAGIDSMTSTSTQGSTRITLQFVLDRDIDGAALDVQSALSSAARRLPDEMTDPPSFRKVNPADQPILFMALTSETLPLSAVDEYAETYIAQRLSTLDGVAQVLVFGAQKYAVRIQIDPNRLASMGVGFNDVEDAVSAANSNSPVGSLSGAEKSAVLQAPGQMTNAAQYRDLIVAYRGGNPVKLGDIGNVLDSVENNKDGELAERQALDRASDPAPARRQHRRGHRPDQEPAARHPGGDPVLGPCRNLDGPVGDHPRLGRGRPVHPRPHHRPGRDGDLPVPAERHRDDHSGSGAAGLDHRHLRRHVCDGLFDRQPVAAGDHALGRLRGR